MLNFFIIGFSLSKSSFPFNIIAHKAGVKERATKVDKPIEQAIHTANCWNILPLIPGIKQTGTNTAIRTNDVAITALVTSCIVTIVASLGDLPS